MGFPRTAAGCVVAFAALFACANLDGLAGGSADGGGGFTPTDGGSSNVEAGAPVTVGGVSISPGSIDFASALCGSSQTAAITLTNAGDAPVSYQLSLPSSPSFSLVGADASGTVKDSVDAHGTAKVTVTANANAPGSENADIAVTIGQATSTLSLSLEASGPGLQISPSTIDFGQVRQGTASVPVDVTLANPGNAPLTIGNFKVSDNFDAPTNVVIPAGKSITAAFTLTAGPPGQPLKEDAEPVIVGPFCGAAPALGLRGQRVSTNVTVNPAIVDFGKVPCGGAGGGTKGSITISNYGITGAVPYTVSLPQSSHFEIVSGAAGSVPSSPDGMIPGTANVTLAVASVAPVPGVVSENVVVTAGGPAASTNVQLTFTVVGASITLPNETLAIANGTQGNAPIENTGNMPVCVAYSVDDAELTLEADKADTLAPNDTSQVITVGFAAAPGSTTKAGNVIGHVKITPTICKGASALPAICGSVPQLTVTREP